MLPDLQRRGCPHMATLLVASVACVRSLTAVQVSITPAVSTAHLSHTDRAIRVTLRRRPVRSINRACHVLEDIEKRSACNDSADQ